MEVLRSLRHVYIRQKKVLHATQHSVSYPSVKTTDACGYCKRVVIIGTVVISVVSGYKDKRGD